MATDEQVQDLKQRLSVLEEYKHKIDKNIYAGFLVIALFSAAGIWGATWFSALEDKILSLETKLLSLNDRTAPFENKFSKWEASIDTATTELEQKKKAAIQEIESEAGHAADLKIKQIQQIKVNDLLAQLKNGSQKLSLSAVEIKNSDGIVAVDIRADQDGDGMILINNESEDKKLSLSLFNDQPQLLFFNDKNKESLIMGVYGDTNKSFIRLLDENADKKLIKIESTRQGGVIQQYHSNGSQIIYSGPEENTGNGLVNVINLDGKKASLSQ
ncbi:MAG: hypothetical protein COA90_00985 [Gammaproteobacteria bacterium]|nr:MAG: hypothetical protein COA90_00985 [Gammaproteobacteria bacterium]